MRTRKFLMDEHELCHAGKKGMKWGYNDGKRNGKRTADINGAPIAQTMSDLLEKQADAKTRMEADGQRRVDNLEKVTDAVTDVIADAVWEITPSTLKKIRNFLKAPLYDIFTGNAGGYWTDEYRIK